MPKFTRDDGTDPTISMPSTNKYEFKTLKVFTKEIDNEFERYNRDSI